MARGAPLSDGIIARTPGSRDGPDIREIGAQRVDGRLIRRAGKVRLQVEDHQGRDYGANAIDQRHGAGRDIEEIKQRSCLVRHAAQKIHLGRVGACPQRSTLARGLAPRRSTLHSAPHRPPARAGRRDRASAARFHRSAMNCAPKDSTGPGVTRTSPNTSRKPATTNCIGSGVRPAARTTAARASMANGIV